MAPTPCAPLAPGGAPGAVCRLDGHARTGGPPRGSPVLQPLHARIRLPGLDPRATYRLEPVELSASALVRTADGPPSWWTTPTSASGDLLATVGLQAPMLYPEQALLLKLVTQDAPDDVVGTTAG